MRFTAFPGALVALARELLHGGFGLLGPASSMGAWQTACWKVCDGDFSPHAGNKGVPRSSCVAHHIRARGCWHCSAQHDHLRCNDDGFREARYGETG